MDFFFLSPWITIVCNLQSTFYMQSPTSNWKRKPNPTEPIARFQLVFNVQFEFLICWLTFKYGYDVSCSAFRTSEEIHFFPVSIAKLFNRIIKEILLPVQKFLMHKWNFQKFSLMVPSNVNSMPSISTLHKRQLKFSNSFIET